MPPGLPSKLDGWKEIAVYLGRDVTTAIRWEHERRLPVHRVPGGKRGAVYAYRHEIDRWLSGYGHGPLAAVGPGALSGGESVLTAQAADRSPAPHTGESEMRAAGGPVPQASGWTQRLVRARAVRWAAAAAALAGLGYAVAAFPGGGTRALLRREQVDHIEYRPDEVVAMSLNGRTLWRHAVASPIEAEKLRRDPYSYAIADLDGDGDRESLVNLEWKAYHGTDYKPRSDDLVCFSSRGQVLWRLSLDDQLTFRSGTYGPPWHEGRVAVYRVDGQTRIAWAQSHLTWWSSIVVILDAKGRRLSRFIHSGQIRALAVVEGLTGPLVLAGGVSNAWRAASLAVLDGRRVAGHSPDPAGSSYECLGCGDDLPARYFLFPPSEIVRATDQSYNFLARIRRVGTALQARTHESEGDLFAELLFEFSPQLELTNAAAGDNWGTHDRLQAAGKLDHSVADCPMYKTPPPVREWTQANGWRDLRPAPTTLASATAKPVAAP